MKLLGRLKRKRKYKNKNEFLLHMHSKKFYMMLLVFITFTILLVVGKMGERTYQTLVIFIVPIWFVTDSAHEAWKKYVDSESTTDNNELDEVSNGD